MEKQWKYMYLWQCHLNRGLFLPFKFPKTFEILATICEKMLGRLILIWMCFLTYLSTLNGQIIWILSFLCQRGRSSLALSSSPISKVENINLWVSEISVISVQSLSCVQLFSTPWTAACQTSLSITNFWSLPKLISIESAIPSQPSHLL